MAYSEFLADQVRRRFARLLNVQEKRMMGGLVFMYNNKMCVGVTRDALMCRIDPTEYEAALMREGCRPMDITKKPMRGFVLVDETALDNDDALDEWVELVLRFNPHAKASAAQKSGTASS